MNRPAPTRISCLIAAAAVLAAAGCSLTGPASIRSSRSTYNAAIAHTSSEQLLLNLVRLRYRDVPLFLEVSSVTTSFEIRAAGSATGAVTTPGLDLVGVRGDISLSERPTVTYLPLQGEKFVKKLMAPLQTETLALMYHSGWSIESILKVCVQRLGPLTNAARASGPTPETPPEFSGFFEAVDLLQSLWLAGDLELGLAADSDDAALIIRFEEHARSSPEVMRLQSLLGLPAGDAIEGLTAEQGLIEGDGVTLVTRSIMACMFFLSQGVVPPDADIERGHVTVTRSPDGEPFDWLQITGGLMHIRSGPQAPKSAYIAVPHRDAWFWIDDADLDSKATFALLGQLLELQSGGAEGVSPILTLPLG